MQHLKCTVRTHFIGKSPIHPLGRLHHQAPHKAIDRAVLVQLVRLRLVLMQKQLVRLPAESSEAPFFMQS